MRLEAYNEGSYNRIRGIEKPFGRRVPRGYKLRREGARNTRAPRLTTATHPRRKEARPMPTICTPAPDIKGAADNGGAPTLSSLQTQLSRHLTFHRRVKAINAALRKAKIDPADPEAYERSREVLTSVLGDERLVEMYLRQLWQVGHGGRYVAFTASVLIRNGQAIRALRERMGADRTQTQTGRSGASDARRPSAINDSTQDGES